jgi:FAD/FMN-containing dehydrogenase
VDPQTRTARAEAGATWGDFDSATQAFGLATTGGVERTTGIAGLTLAGGYGFLMRKHGLTCDNLLSADVVTAGGGTLVASADQNSDLFWGLRGGGGNFGIVTSFEYRLHPVESVYGGLVVYPIDRAREIIKRYDDFVVSAPDELGSLLVLSTLPDGTKAVILLICYCGGEEEGRRCIQPLTGAGTPLMNQLGQMPYLAVQSIVEKFNPRGLRNYWRSSFLKEVCAPAADAMVEQFLEAPAPYSHVVLYTLGGAVARVARDATAVENRYGRHSFLIVGMWKDESEDERDIAWVRALANSIEPFSSGGYYVNFDSESTADRVQLAYGKEKFARLQALKDKYDPTNFLRLNQNIRPSE